jgi:hypothetical protein
MSVHLSVLDKKYKTGKNRRFTGWFNKTATPAVPVNHRFFSKFNPNYFFEKLYRKWKPPINHPIGLVNHHFWPVWVLV